MRRLALLLSLLFSGAALAAPAAHFTVRADPPEHHYFQVEARYAAQGEQLTLFMPVWTPGSYLVREHSRHVEQVEARDAGGRRLAVQKVAKNRWQVDTDGAGPIAVRYRVYAFELSVRTNYLDAEFGLTNGPALFLLPVDAKADADYDVTLVPPGGWGVHTALPPHPQATGRHHFRADRDTLLDSPVVWGRPTVETFTVAGVDHHIVTVGAPAELFDPARAARDLAKLVDTQRAFWGALPGYDNYLFLNVLADSGGGLEHKASTVIMGDRQVMRDPEHYRDWLRLASHELFHAWNVKRLRPQALGPFDYEVENHTHSLWVAEGITSYYDGLLWRRAGLADDKAFLERLSKNIKRLQTSPGRHVRSLALASFDAWIRFYRHDENSVNADVSYYTKGAVVAFLLDAHLRKATADKVTLGDVMRAAYARFSGAKGFTPAEFQALASDVAGVDLDDFFDRAVRGTADLDYGPALAWFGLRFKPADASPDPAGWLGLTTHGAEGRLYIKEVPTGTPAHRAGLAPNDELLAIGEHRIPAKGWDEARGRQAPGEQTSVLVARRGVLRRLPVTFAAEPAETWALEPDPKASPAQKARLKAWLTAR
ncbi:MAG: M61 family metallopeptidase [Myxococcales bacterium]|nr:M61 family metallopeptidase [Myxococcales bacterium]MCB9524937.1 M61 family metallopeptidase [Myxococcales bacterium]